MDQKNNQFQNQLNIKQFNSQRTNYSTNDSLTNHNQEIQNENHITILNQKQIDHQRQVIEKLLNRKRQIFKNSKTDRSTQATYSNPTEQVQLNCSSIGFSSLKSSQVVTPRYNQKYRQKKGLSLCFLKQIQIAKNPEHYLSRFSNNTLYFQKNKDYNIEMSNNSQLKNRLIRIQEQINKIHGKLNLGETDINYISQNQQNFYNNISSESMRKKDRIQYYQSPIQYNIKQLYKFNP